MHGEAVTVLMRQIDLLYYMRHTGDRAEMRRVLRALIRSVRSLRNQWHGLCPETRHRAPGWVRDKLYIRAHAEELAAEHARFVDLQRRYEAMMRDVSNRASPSALRQLREDIRIAMARQHDCDDWD